MSQIDTDISDVAKNLTRLASIFERVGNILNVLNRIIAIAIPIFTALFMSASGIDPGIVYFLISLLVAGILFFSGWVQIAVLRILALFFKMKGLLALREIELKR